MKASHNKIEDIKARVEKATVQLPDSGGQGVLVPGEFIITVAHCVNWTIEGGMILGGNYGGRIKTKEGKYIKVEPCVVEPVSDIAVLSGLDNQTFWEESEAFEDFCYNTPNIPLCSAEFEPRKHIPVYLLTHKGEWVVGQVYRMSAEPRGTMVLEAECEIERGTSGGPVINEGGELVGICSLGADAVPMPCPHFALPCWVLTQISSASKEKIGNVGVQIEEFLKKEEKGGDQS